MDELFTCTDDMYCWLYDCVNVSYTVIFLLFVCLWYVPHPIVLWLSRIYGMNICMYYTTSRRANTYKVAQVWLTTVAHIYTLSHICLALSQAVWQRHTGIICTNKWVCFCKCCISKFLIVQNSNFLAVWFAIIVSNLLELLI
jgi:hypothetical protein